MSEEFQAVVGGYLTARRDASDLELTARAMAAHFEVSPSTVIRWSIGTARPHPRLQKQIIAWIAERLKP